MTLLIGASVLLILASAIALVFGWATANGSLIWTSIVASAAAAIALALAFFRSRVEAAAIARGRPERRAGPASGDEASGSPEGSSKVMVVRESKRYHRPDCRYASSGGAESMTKGAAHREGFSPCGICKP